MIKPAAPITAAGRYEKLREEREPFLRRAREVALVTIPSLMPPEGHTSASDFETPYQGVGARGLNNLASKLLLSLFPPGSPFFRLTLDDFVLAELAENAASEDVRGEFEEALSRVERAMMARLEAGNFRSVLFECFKLLIATGNALIFSAPDATLKLFRLDAFVVKRDLSGNVVEIIVKEGLSRLTLPPKVAALLADEDNPAEVKDPADAKSTVDLYTRIYLDGRRWRVYQEVGGKVVPGTEGTYPKDRLPWLALRWTWVPGESYGRGHAEEYLGDLKSCESLSQSIVAFAAVAARILFMVNEAGVTRKSDIADAPSGAVVDGDARDVTVLGLEKFPDFTIAKSTADDVKQRLEQAFLLHSSIQRNAERVTAEEIRYMAGELEQALGGVYSAFAQELQLPLVRVVMAAMQKANALPSLPEKAVVPQIITGVEGLGRSSDLNKLDVLVSGLAELFGPEAVATYVNPGAYTKRRASALGIDIEGVVRSDEEVKAQQQEAMAASMAQSALPQAVKAQSDQQIAAAQMAQSAPQLASA